MSTAKLDPNRAPTLDELDEASEYATSKLCLEIPARITPGLTTWDGNMKKCRITQGGCAASVGNPLSLYSFSTGGTLSASDSAMANPVPFKPLGNQAIDNYNHYTNKGFPSAGH